MFGEWNIQQALDSQRLQFFLFLFFFFLFFLFFCSLLRGVGLWLLCICVARYGVLEVRWVHTRHLRHVRVGGHAGKVITRYARGGRNPEHGWWEVNIRHYTTTAGL